MGQPERRRRYLVNKKIQYQFTFLLIIHILVPTVIFGSSMYVMHRMYQSCLQELTGSLAPLAQNMLYIYVLGLCLFIIVSIMLLTFLGIRFTHHIVGPLYKLGNNIEKLAKGEKIEPLHFRKTDIIKSNIADNFNTIAEKLNLLKRS